MKNFVPIVSAAKSVTISYEADTIFNYISSTFYRENFHSDIIAYLFSHEKVLHPFLNWIQSSLNGSDFNSKRYDRCIIERERHNIDLIIWSEDKTRAIIIENKSNNANFQPRQIYRYYTELTSKNISVDAIIIINKNGLKYKAYSDLNTDEIAQIRDITLTTQLIGHNSINDNVFSNTLNNSDNIKLNGIILETRSLFETLVNGNNKMENMDKFIQLLSTKSNYSEFQHAIEIYNKIPAYLAESIKIWIELEYPGEFTLWIWKGTTLAIDFTYNNLEFAIDLIFSTKQVEINLHGRNNNDPMIFSNIKNFPFSEILENNRFRNYYKTTQFFDETEKSKILSPYLDMFGNLSQSSIST